MDNYTTLKIQIQDALPSLKDLTTGCIIETPTFNCFKQKYEKDCWDEYIIYGDKIVEYYTNDYKCDVCDIFKYFNESTIRFGKRPKLNDVLNWLQIISEKTYGKDNLNFYNNFIKNHLGLWNLNSAYLEDQGEFLIATILKNYVIK